MKKLFFMRKPFYLFLLLVIISLTNCGKEDRLNPEEEKIPVNFSSILFENDITRAVGTTWENNDQIGVFAITHNSSLSPENIVDESINLPFVTLMGDGSFKAVGKNIYFPKDNAPIDIIAYYPYKADLTDYNYPVDITEQPEIFYSNNLTNVNIEYPENTGLQFRRILSRVIFNITPEENNGSLSGLSVLIEGAKTKASFSLVDGSLTVNDQSEQELSMTISGDDTHKQASVILLPTSQEKELTAQFKLNGKTYKWILPDALESGKVYRYTVQLKGTEPIVSTSSAYMEIPVYTSSAVAPNSATALHMVESLSWLNSSFTQNAPSSIRNYSVLFDTKNRVPYWVAFPLHPAYMDGGNRTDAWGHDPIIPKNVQPNLRSGWDSKTYNRGHLLASADRSATATINRTTFYYTNMAPQNSNMNSGPWGKLEEKVRTWSKQNGYDTLYVVTGCILPKSPEPFVYVKDNDGKNSAVPKYLYKALLRKNKNSNSYSSIVFKMENTSTSGAYDNSKNIISVEELEKETGFTFFSNLPKEVAATVKKNKSLSPDWN